MLEFSSTEQTYLEMQMLSLCLETCLEAVYWLPIEEEGLQQQKSISVDLIQFA